MVARHAATLVKQGKRGVGSHARAPECPDHTRRRKETPVFNKFALATYDTQRPLLRALKPSLERESQLKQR